MMVSIIGHSVFQWNLYQHLLLLLPKSGLLFGRYSVEEVLDLCDVGDELVVDEEAVVWL